ncbi:MAG: hypothetical protein K6G88_07795 [Lachnospiraceae bacterium]|nr:hypothetical protein [Lachnospiraceae bacterium]
MQDSKDAISKLVNIMAMCIVCLWVMLVVVFGDFMCEKVCADLAGNGTNNKPYEVSSYSDFKSALTSKKRQEGTTYIKITGDIIITNVIKVEGGSFVIYSNRDCKISKSTNSNDDINAKGGYRYCIHVGMDNKTEVKIGTKGDGCIFLDGNRSYYEKNKVQSSGWMYVGAKANVELGSKTCAQNMINNKKEKQTSNFTVNGELTINCVIKNCAAQNGGAVFVTKGGKLWINKYANISNCHAETEGGAVTIKGSASLYMSGGAIHNNSAGEEGGAIFVSDEEAYAEITDGNISYNKAGKSSGAVFSGYGARMIIGDNGYGPNIRFNIADGSGGAIKCNGGDGVKAGGTTYIYGGIISDNQSGKNGGGIAVGEVGAESLGVFHLESTQIYNNHAEKDGGGVCIYKGNAGKNGEVKLIQSDIDDNYAKEKGSGLMTNSFVEISGCNIRRNGTPGCGGGIYIGKNGGVTSEGGYVNGNKANNSGNGIFVDGRLKIGHNFVIGRNDVVYLNTEKYVEIISGFNYSSERYFSIDSKVKSVGTKVVFVSAPNLTSQLFLYGSNTGEIDEANGKSVSKKVEHISSGSNLRLRSCTNIGSGIERWIWITRTYKVSYMKNVDAQVYNMPTVQYLFHGESLNLVKEMPYATDYELVKDKMWNTSKNGDGMVFVPGSRYSTNEEITLYAIWRKKLNLSMTVKNRYYLVGQKVKMSVAELVKKVKVTDNLDSDYPYKISITKIERYKPKVNKNLGYEKSNIEELSFENINSEEVYIEEINIEDIRIDEEGAYKVYVSTVNEDYNKTIQSNFTVKILSPKADRKIRFISAKYLNTIDNSSIWKRNERNYLKLKKVLGDDAKAVSEYHFDSQAVKEKMKMSNGL